MSKMSGIYMGRKQPKREPKMRPCKDCGNKTRSHILENFSCYCHKCKTKYTDEQWQEIVDKAKTTREGELERRRDFMAGLAKRRSESSIKDNIEDAIVETEQLSDTVTLIKTKKKTLLERETSDTKTEPEM